MPSFPDDKNYVIFRKLLILLVKCGSTVVNLPRWIRTLEYSLKNSAFSKSLQLINFKMKFLHSSVLLPSPISKFENKELQ